jgi:hypothetical protein
MIEPSSMLTAVRRSIPVPDREPVGSHGAHRLQVLVLVRELGVQRRLTAFEVREHIVV